MRAPEILKAIEPWLVRRRRPAWKPVVIEGDGPTTASNFCGVPWIALNAPWPNCGSCREPLSPFLQLDLGKLPEQFAKQFGDGLLQLFYCTRDDCQGEGGWEPFANDLNFVRIVQPTEAALAPNAEQLETLLPAKQIVDWSQFVDLPAPAEHDELGLIYSYDFNAGTLRIQCPEVGFDITNRMSECPVEEIATCESGDKLGGWPAWVQGVEYPDCPECGRRMEHVFQVDSEDNIPFMFGDVGCGHITQCPDHKEIVAFGWACS